MIGCSSKLERLQVFYPIRLNPRKPLILSVFVLHSEYGICALVCELYLCSLGLGEISKIV